MARFPEDQPGACYSPVWLITREWDSWWNLPPSNGKRRLFCFKSSKHIKQHITQTPGSLHWWGGLEFSTATGFRTMLALRWKTLTSLTRLRVSPRHVCFGVFTGRTGNENYPDWGCAFSKGCWNQYCFAFFLEHSGELCFCWKLSVEGWRWSLQRGEGGGEDTLS